MLVVYLIQVLAGSVGCNTLVYVIFVEMENRKVSDGNDDTENAENEGDNATDFDDPVSESVENGALLRSALSALSALAV